MKQDRIYKTLNMLFIIAGLLCCAYTSSKADAFMDKNVFYISPYINDNKNYLSADGLENLKNFNISAIYSYESRKTSLIRFGKTEAYAEIFATNENFFTLNNIKFKNGSGWVAGMEEEKNVVVNESLAWLIYGNTNVIGAELIISGESYYITGVVKQDKISKDDCRAWLPLSPAFYGEKNLSAAYVKIGGYNPISPIKSMASWLGGGGRRYYITDINLYKESITIRYKLLLWIICLCTALFFTKRIYLFIKRNKKNTGSLPFAVIGVFLNIILIIFIWREAGFDIWIPKFTGTVFQQVLQAIFNWNKLPPREYLTGGVLELSRLNLYANISFGFGFAGLLNFILIPPRARREDVV